MAHLSSKHISYWVDSTPATTYLPFVNGSSVDVDVAVIGAGIVGLTAATLLKQAGKTVAVIESSQVATGVSGHTTAKITSLHQLIYADLIKQIGEQKALLYADSNQAAIEYIATQVSEQQIDCDFSRQSAYTFTESIENIDSIKEEVEAALLLGLPVSFVQDTPLPFAIAGAIRCDNQAQFHVRRYLLHLAKKISGNGSHLFENTRVVKVEEGEPNQIITEQGSLTAKDVIVATHLPILDKGLFFAKTYPKRSYIVGARIDTEKAPVGMHIGSGEEYFSVRVTPFEQGSLLLVGGGGHKTGTYHKTEDQYQKLEAYVYDRFKIDSVDYRWSTQDMVSVDKLPYIGHLTPFNQHIYVATGFSLWGMSKGTMSAMVLSDLILGRDNPYVDLYDATRATPFLTPQALRQGISLANHWVGDRLTKFDTSSFSELSPDEGKLVEIDDKKIAAYRDEDGTVHAVSAICSHLGCIVSWNSGEKSWDCACHGSRFSYEGQILHGPAVHNLEQVTVKPLLEPEIIPNK